MKRIAPLTKRNWKKLVAQLYTKGILSNEIHYYTSGLWVNSLPVINGTANGNRIQHLTGTYQGDTSINRQGNKIFVRHIFIKLALAYDVTSTQDFATATFLVVRDKHPTSPITLTAPGPPTINDVLVLQRPTPPTTDEEALIATADWKHVYAINQDRFEILWRKTMNLLSNPAAGKKYRTVKRKIRVMQPCNYTGPNGDDTAGPGHCYLFGWSTGKTITGTLIPVAYGWRTSFTDV